MANRSLDKVRKIGRPLLLSKEIDKIVRGYERFGTLGRVAEETGHAPLSVSKYLDKRGVKRRTYPRCGDEQLLILFAYYFFDANASKTEREIGIPAKSVLNLWKQAGLKTRKGGHQKDIDYNYRVSSF